MVEYIEREKIWPALNAACVPYNRATANAIESIPAADVVEVVRCKDCIQHVPDSCFCRMTDWTTSDEDFCSFAVKMRKADGT
jgi:hypothetical protein